jgi:drug/metabolite transporter (DMT)-like permease
LRTSISDNSTSAPGASATIIRSIALMVASSGLLTVNDAIVKWLAQTYPVGQVMSLRGVFVIGIVVAWALARRHTGALRVYNWRLQLARGGLMSLSTFLFVTALTLMPLADAIAITFAGPILATALAALLLHEPVGWRRWSAVAIGFTGVVLMMRPTPELVRLFAIVPLLAALMGALRDIVTRKMGTGGESTLAILLISTLVVTLAGLLTIPWGWSPLRLVDLVLFAGSALLVGCAQGFMIESFRLGEVGLVAPFKYASLIWAVLLGLLVWGDRPDPWTWAGASLVVGGGLYLWHRELALARMKDVQPTSGSTGQSGCSRSKATATTSFPPGA